MEKKSLLQLLIEREFCDDERQARGLIMAGKVLVNEQRVDKPGLILDGNPPIRIKGRTAGYVSRGAIKLKTAIASLSLESAFQGQVTLDVGASTGGFTQILLEHDACKVYAVEIGSNQLDWKLRTDQRVHCLEKTDVRTLPAGFDNEISWIVGDVSFISLAKLLPAIVKLSNHPHLQLLLLVKPQFELHESLVPTGGVVASDKLRQAAVQQVSEACAALQLTVRASIDCSLPGRYGNREIFVWLRR